MLTIRTALSIGLFTLAAATATAAPTGTGSPAPSPAPSVAAAALPFTPEEFAPKSEPERALLQEIAERMAGIAKAGDATPVEEQKLAAYKRYFTEYPGGKFRPVAVGAYTKAMRRAGKHDELLAAARDLVGKDATGPRGEVALTLLKHYLAAGGEPAKAIAVLDEESKNADKEVAWRGTLGGAQIFGMTGDFEGAIARLEKSDAKSLSPAQSLERDFWLGRLLHERSTTLKGDERTKLEARAKEMLERVATACEKDPAPNAAFAAAFIGLARLGLAHADAAQAKGNYEKVAKLYPGTPEAQEAGMLAPQVELLGKPAPEFEGKDLAGKPVSSKLLAGKIALVDFWATTCPPCLKEAPNLARLAKDAKARPFAIISISLDLPGRADEISAFLKKTNIEWPQVYEGAGWKSEIAAKYHVNAIPSMFLLDETGTVKRVGLEGDELREAVEAELARLEKAPKK